MEYLGKLHQAAVEFPQTDIWMDSCGEEELEYGLKRGIVGATSNPIIVGNVIKNELNIWEKRIKEMVVEMKDASEEDIAWELIYEIGALRSKKLLPVFEANKGKKGRLSLQVNAKYYRNKDKMVEQAVKINSLAPNMQVKIPASAAGVEAMEEATYRGISINATVSFTVAQAVAVAEAVERGLKRREAEGLDNSQMAPICTIMIGRTAEQMTAYIKTKNAKVPQSVLDMIPFYLSEGEAENIRGDIAFAQSCLETGNFTFSGSAVKLSQNNFCGMGVTGNGMTGNSFDTPQLGIRAQIQHLKAYANTVKLKGECIDPRFKYVTRGSAPYVEYLGIQENPKRKGWAAGAGYGKKILTILAAITGTKADEKPQTPQQPQTPQKPQENATEFKPYLITTTTEALRIRDKPNGSIVGAIREREGHKNKYTIVEEQNGWGRLKSGAGWISLEFCKKTGETTSTTTTQSTRFAAPRIVWY